MKKLLSLLLALMLVFSLCACGASGGSYAQTSEMAYDSYYADSAPAAAEPRMAGEYNGLSMNVAGAEADYGAESGESQSELPEADPDKIIYSADATVETLDFEATLAGLDEMIKDYGGWVESSSINGSNYTSDAKLSTARRSAYYNIRIPSAKFSELMSTLSNLGNVPYTHTYTDNVTSQYYDTAARLEALETQEARLLDMMEMAETVEDIITIDDKLTSVRYQIESLQSTLNNWDRQVSYSTVSISINEVREYTPDSPAVDVSYGEQLLNSFKVGLRDVADFFADFLLWFVEALPALVVFAVIIVILFPVYKKLRKSRREKCSANEKGTDYEAAKRVSKRAAKNVAKEAAKLDTSKADKNDSDNLKD